MIDANPEPPKEKEIISTPNNKEVVNKETVVNEEKVFNKEKVVNK